MKNEDFEKLIQSIREGGKIMKCKAKPSRVFHFPESRISKVRRRYRLSQSKFAAMMGISVNTLRNWEQGRRKPEGPARVLLNVVAKHPEAVLDVVGIGNSR
ncbi:MAG: helix-turn-helix domain-containing protein [Chitinivibrionales bacterium]|nr:helix-turn-helix domain-containing protein [Chitinivibrionales bacterium]